MARDKIKMVSTGKTKAGKTTGTFRTTTKNKRTSTGKREQKHYDRLAYDAEAGKCGKHVLFVESKI